jgi:hypothetical protein
MSKDLLSILLEEAGAIVKPLRQALADPQALENLLTILGTDTETIGEANLLDGLGAVNLAMQRFEELRAAQSPSLDAVGAGLNALSESFSAVRSLSSASPTTYPEFGTYLIELLVMSYLRHKSPLAFQLAASLGLVGFNSIPNQSGDGPPPRIPTPVLGFDHDKLRSLLTDPVATLRAPFPASPLATLESANQTADLVVERIGGLLNALGVPWLYGFQAEDAEFFPDAAPFMDHALLIYAPESLVGKSEAGLCLALSPADGDDLGLVVTPFGGLNINRQVFGWDFDLALTADVRAFAVGGGQGFRLLANPGGAHAQLSLKATRPRVEEGPAFVIGAPDGTRLEIGELQISTDVRLAAGGSAVTAAVDAKSGALALIPGDADGFLSAVLPKDGLRCEFDLGVELSSERGFRLRGAAGLDASIPIGLSIGAVTVPTLYLSLGANESGISAEVSANVGVSIGPVHASIERVGIAAAVTFPEDGGNLGVANLDIGFKHPNGVGLSIDGTAVSGGGFLSFDVEKGQYAGVVQLNLQGDISVKAIGLIATKLPNNASGFSLLVIITAEDFKPIPLPLGFKLTGIGGLLAINRTFDEEALRAGLKNHTLDSVLFPKDPVRNAPQILSNLNKVFPMAKGHHLFGPVVQIAWGSSSLITADLAVVMELGARLRLLIMAQIAAILPRPENDLIRLKMDAIGVIDFDQGTAALDATLHDSRLLKKFTLTGDMAMRLKWEGGPNFALAVGGLHPAFNPPPNFPKLERVAINLSSGDNPRIRCEAYFALTSNTVQFGARAELYAAAAGFSVQGDIGFDVLIQFDPFQFLADFHAQVQLKRGSTNLFKIRLEGELAGPRPLRIKAKATFEVLWMDVSFRVDKTLVAGARPEPPAPVAVMPLLKEALGDPGNWTAKLPAGGRQMVTLRANPGTPSDVLLHPLGSLTVKQNVVPLNVDISRFGHASPDGARRFTISSVSTGVGDQTAPPTVRDFFAPAQFFEMSDGEKISRPSFEQMSAGVAIGSDEFAFTTDANDWMEVDAIKFETYIVDKQQNESSRGGSFLYELSPGHLEKQSRFGAAGASELRRSGKAKYRAAAPKYRIEKEGWSIVATDDLRTQPVPGVEEGKPVSYAEAAQTLRKLKQENPEAAAGLKILRLSELPEA